MDDNEDQEAALRQKLSELRTEHADLDVAVRAIESARVPDAMAISRLKKRKLMLKDQISTIEDQLTPDIIA